VSGTDASAGEGWWKGRMSLPELRCIPGEIQPQISIDMAAQGTEILR